MHNETERYRDTTHGLKTPGLPCGNFSDLNSACLKVLVPVKIFQFPDMRNEIERYRDATNGL